VNLPLQVGLLGLVIAAVDPDVAEGLSLYQRLKYDRAVVALGRALAKHELPREDRVAALETLGFAYTVLGDATNSELTFHNLLDLAPTYALDPSLSPRLLSAFAQAKSSWIEGRTVQFELRSSLSSRDLEGTLLGGDDRRVGSVVARLGDGAAMPLLCRDRGCRGERPRERFTIEVLDHTGALLSTSGPYEAAPEDSDGEPWWVLALIAAAAVGGGVALTLAIAGSDEAPPGSLGRLQLP
jgi:hypothetical protein